MTQNKKNKLGCGCFGISLLIIVAAGLGYYFGRKLLLGEELTPLSGSEIIPASAVATGFISTDINDWQELQQFDTISAQQTIEETWEEWQTELRQENIDINYQEDIEPWLGGLMISLLPNPDDTSEPSIGIIAGVKNKLKARNFLNKIRENQNTEVVETEYQNTTVYQIISEDDPQGVWFTFFDSHAVISDEQRVVEEFIDTSKGADSIAQVKQANEATQEKLNENNPLFQFYITDYNYFLGDVVAESFNFPDSVEIPVIETAVTSLDIQDHGLNFSTIVGLSEPLYGENSATTTHELVDKISGDVIFMLDGIALKNIWEEIESNRQLIPELDEFIFNLESFSQELLNLSLRDDVFGWMDGEFAFGLSVDQNNSFAESGVKGLFLMETSDRTVGENTLTQIERLAQSDSLLQVEKAENNGVASTTWNIPQGQLLSYGWLENNLLFINFSQEENIVDNINNNPSLQENENFTLTTQTLPENNFGYVYFDLERTINVLNEFDPSLLANTPPEAQQIINALKGVAITSSSINSNTSQLDINISLKKQ